jgi:hypothetical protein
MLAARGSRPSRLRSLSVSNRRQGIGAPKKPLKMRQNYRQNCFYADVGPDSLESLYQQSIKFHEERQKFGRRIITDESAA